MQWVAGFDMEDAMILSKSSVDRGLAHSSLYKVETIDLTDQKGKYLVRFPRCKKRGGCGKQGGLTKEVKRSHLQF